MRLFICCLLLWPFTAVAQQLSGTIYTSDGDLLPFASVSVKGRQDGVSANNNARYTLRLEPGTYTVVCQHLGYKTQEKQVQVKENMELDFILQKQELTLEEVSVSSDGENPAYRIIRAAIKRKNELSGKSVPYSVMRYNKDILKMVNLPDKIFGQKIDKNEMEGNGLDSMGRGILYLSEALSKISFDPPKKFKLDVLNSRVSGSDQFGFNFPIFIDLNQNNVIIFLETFNKRGFISPIADGAINYYRFRLLGTFFEGDKMIYSIEMKPRRRFEPLFNGVINIVDGDWVIHSVDAYLTKESQLELVDTLKLQQLKMHDGNKWLLRNQVLTIRGNVLGFEVSGTFHNVYNDYNFSPEFTKKTFSNVIIEYDTAVVSKPKSWWDTIRPVPLEEEEVKNYQVKDSIYTVEKANKNTQAYIDSLRKWQGKIKPHKLLLSGIHRNHYSLTNSYSWGVESVLWNTHYNSVEGLNMTFIPYWSKWYKKNLVTVEGNIRYGFLNGHLNPALKLEIRKRGGDQMTAYGNRTLTFSGGKSVRQFNPSNPISEFNNTLSTFLRGNNFMKIYENNFASAEYSRSWESGVRLNMQALYEDRLPLDNNTNYVLIKKHRNQFTPNYPFEKIPQQFTRHQAVVLHTSISIQPGQKYIVFPKSKVSMGSSWPVFTFDYVKGFKDVMNSDVDFDRWKVTINGNKNMRIAGSLNYRVGAGGFFNSAAVPIHDHWHFNGNLTDALSNLTNGFQMASYYKLSNTEPVFGFAHVEHHLNGLLSNKIPGFKKMNIQFVTGANVFYANQNFNYTEVFFGLENIMKVLRVDLVAGLEKGRSPQWGVKFGAGGLFGNFVNAFQGGRRRQTFELK